MSDAPAEALAFAPAILPELGPPGWIALGLIGLGATCYGIHEWYENRSSAADTAKANARAQTLSDATTDTACKICCERTVVISRAVSPQAAQHIVDAQAAGYPSTLTLDRPGKMARSRAAMAASGIATAPGMDRDEYPPATFAEGGAGASVRLMPLSDNRAAGAQLRNQMNSPTPATEGCKVTIKVGP